MGRGPSHEKRRFGSGQELFVGNGWYGDFYSLSSVRPGCTIRLRETCGSKEQGVAHAQLDDQDARHKGLARNALLLSYDSMGMMGDACMSKSYRVSAFGSSHPTLRTGQENRPAFNVSLGP